MDKSDLQLLRTRASVLRLIRGFFSGRGYLEVDTPLLSPQLIPESSLEVFRTLYRTPGGGEQELFLIPSPELWMKRLLAAGSGSLFQICHSFRNSEPQTSIHNPEFTMLEWYTVDSGYREAMDLTEALFAHILEGLPAPALRRDRDALPQLSPPFLRLSMARAFREYLGEDLAELLSNGEDALRSACGRLDLKPGPEDDEADLFHRLFLSGVEPRLPSSRPLILYDYPACIPTLARARADGIWAERWELYVRGVEIANCYTEENDPRRLRSYYERQERAKSAALVVHPSDRELLEILCSTGLPECSGVALGLDRLLLFLLAEPSLRRTLPLSPFHHEA